MTARRLLALALLACLGGCGKDTDTWLAELRDGEPFTRTLAAIAVRDAPPAEHARVAEALLQMLVIEEDDTVLGHGKASLEQLASSSPETLIELMVRPESRSSRYLLVEALARAGDRARPSLLEALRGAGPADRSSLAVALARTGGPGVEQLVGWTGDGEPAKLAAAMAGLQTAGARGQQLIPDLAARLLACLDDVGPWPRPSVVEAMIDASEQSAVAAWALALAVEGGPAARREEVQAAVVRGVVRGMVHERPHNLAAPLLGRLGDRAVPYLIDAVLVAEDSRVKRWAAVSLAAMGPSCVTAMLERGVEDRWLALVLTGLGEPGWAALRAAATSDDEVVRRAAKRFQRQ